MNIKGTSTKIYICNMELPEGVCLDMEKLADRLSVERQQKIKARRFEKDRLQALGAGLLLDYGLREYGLREREVSMTFKGNGKPYLADYPDIRFNLSHSGSMVMAVFSDREAGCDVERLSQARMSVAQRFFTEEETAYLEAQNSDAERNQMFFRLWTLKESYLKATGEGMRMALNSFRICLEGMYPTAWSCVNPGMDANAAPDAASSAARGQAALLDYEFREFSVPGYRAAVCLESREPKGSSDVFFSFQNLQDVV